MRGRKRLASMSKGSARTATRRRAARAAIAMTRRRMDFQLTPMLVPNGAGVKRRAQAGSVAATGEVFLAREPRRLQFEPSLLLRLKEFDRIFGSAGIVGIEIALMRHPVGDCKIQTGRTSGVCPIREIKTVTHTHRYP